MTTPTNATTEIGSLVRHVARGFNNKLTRPLHQSIYFHPKHLTSRLPVLTVVVRLRVIDRQGAGVVHPSLRGTRLRGGHQALAVRLTHTKQKEERYESIDHKTILTTNLAACVCVCVQNVTHFCPYALISSSNVPKILFA